MKKLALLLAVPALLAAQNITLPSPAVEGGMPLYTALKNRSTERDFDKKRPLTEKQISQILWAAAGKNREKDEKRTAPSAWGNNEVELYVLLQSGSYKYDAVKHTLVQLSKEDQRNLGGKQKFVKDAPMTIVLVGDLEKITQTKDETHKLNTAYVDAGYISQNIYLAAESEGLITGARGWIDHEAIIKGLKLSETQRPIIANSVGYLK